MLIGYVRVSTEEQNESRQITALQERNTDRLFIDKQSGKDTNRAALREMLAFVRDGDVVITESISRIARSTKDLLNIIDILTEKNVEFISIKENIDTTTPQGKFMLTVFAAMAELERESILQRQKEGIAEAKKKGKYHGRPKADFDLEKLKKVCSRWRSGEITATAAMQQMSMKPNTFYRRVKENNL